MRCLKAIGCVIFLVCLGMYMPGIRAILAPLNPWVISGGYAKREFDHDLWILGQGQRRFNMAHWLVENKILEGKSRTELIEMLGAPDVDQPGDEGVRWLLGYKPKGLFDESLWLELTIGPDSRVRCAVVGVHW
jgi:hypothetical protein